MWVFKLIYLVSLFLHRLHFQIFTLSQLCKEMEQDQLQEIGGFQEIKGKESIEMGKDLGLETPPNETKEKRGEKEEPKKQRKKKEEPGYTPEARQEEEEEERLVFLPVSLDLDKLKDWAVPASEGDKGALVEVNNRKVFFILNPRI